MPKATNFFGGKYITKEMVLEMSEKERECSIDHVAVEHISGAQRLVLYTDKHDVGLPLNTSRIEALIEIHGGGEETDDWRGTKIRLIVDESVRYQGKRVGGVMVEGV